MYKQRFLLDSDGGNFFIFALTDDPEGDIRREVSRLPKNVTTYLLCPNAGGAFYNPTKIGDIYKPAVELVNAFERSEDPFDTFLSEVKRSGRETMITYRMNDVHEADKADSPMTATFKKQNPKLTVGYAELGEEFFSGKKLPWMKYCLNYEEPDVQEYILSIFEELCKYDIDGLQLDWMRFPCHLPGTPDEVWEKREVLTNFTEKVRAVLDNNGKGRILSARVPTTLKGCHDLGIDLVDWTKSGLIDFVTLSPFLTTDIVIRAEEIKDQIGSVIPVYTAIEFDNARQPHTPESLRATALSMSEAGSDGIYMFNFPCWTEYVAMTPYNWLEGLDYDEGRTEKPLNFVISYNKYRTDVDMPAQLPKTASASGGEAAFTLQMPPKALPAADALILVQAKAKDMMEVSINGIILKQLKKSRQHDLFVGFLNAYNPKEGGYIADDKSEIHIFRITQDVLNPGVWNIIIKNTGAEPFDITRMNIGLW